jgi:hypothetical protein
MMLSLFMGRDVGYGFSKRGHTDGSEGPEFSNIGKTGGPHIPHITGGTALLLNDRKI